MSRILRDFFNRHTLDVAQELVGKEMFFGNFRGIITETEAYRGQDDAACHAARGLTPRTAVMFGPAGFSYVYIIYGIYNCLNFVAEEEGTPAAVLIRGLYLPEQKLHLDGPGKLCRKLEITRLHNKLDITLEKNFGIRDINFNPEYIATPRIGITKNKDKLWRFITNIS